MRVLGMYTCYLLTPVPLTGTLFSMIFSVIVGYVFGKKGFAHGTSQTHLYRVYLNGMLVIVAGKGERLSGLSVQFGTRHLGSNVTRVSPQANVAHTTIGSAILVQIIMRMRGLYGCVLSMCGIACLATVKVVKLVKLGRLGLANLLGLHVDLVSGKTRVTLIVLVQARSVGRLRTSRLVRPTILSNGRVGNLLQLAMRIRQLRGKGLYLIIKVTLLAVAMNDDTQYVCGTTVTNWTPLDRGLHMNNVIVIGMFLIGLHH